MSPSTEMATLANPVELPAGRHSFVEFPMTANIQDPTYWGALTNDGNPTRSNSKLTLSTESFGRTSTMTSSRPPSRGQLSLRVKASPAVEFPPQELDSQPLSYFPPRQSSAPAPRKDPSGKQNTQENRSDTSHTTQTSDDYTESASGASTTGTTSLQESQVYSLPDSNADKAETIESPVLPSNRSIASSVKKSVVPTSKYKKKPPPSLRSSIKRKSEVETPIGSPVSAFTQHAQSPIDGQDQMPSELPAAFTMKPTPTPPPEAQGRLGQAPLQYAKSTASVRKARALHSHPSMPTLRSDEPSSSPQLPQGSPNLSTPRGRKSAEPPRRSLYELQEPTPAPNTPLPDLPAGVAPLSRSASRNTLIHPTPPPDVHVRPGTSSSNIATAMRRQDNSTQIHAEMANFMTSNSKVIFRRFHDVHIRLLLTLQDEISALEKELADIEDVDNPIDVDREARRVKILSELRKLLAEYDHLFGNWNLMQDAKADDKSKKDLENWLKRPETISNPETSTGTIDDLLWLQTHSKDLSCVDLNAAKKSTVNVTEKEIKSEKREKSKVKTKVEASPARNTSGGGGGGGGFASLFASCTGKRK